MYSIAIKNARFHLPIGLYAEEHLLGNEIILNLRLGYKKMPEGIKYIDYVEVYNLVSNIIKKAPPTLEEVLFEIKSVIYQQYPDCLLYVQICKNNPPIPGEINSVCVSWDDF